MAKLLSSANLLGLGAFTGGRLNPIYGTVIGGGVAVTAMLAARHIGGSKSPELIGLGAGLASSAIMATMRSTRGAAVGGAIGAILGAGVPWLGKMIMGEATVPAATVPPQVKGLGFPQARELGIARMAALNGLGYPEMSPVAHAHGTIPGVAGSQLAGPNGGGPPVSLLGQPTAAGMHLLGIGGPPVHGLSAAYGATLLGSGR